MITEIPYKERFLRQGIQLDTLQAFLDSVNQHIAYVQEAGQKLGVSQGQLKRHDRSKFSKEEFGAYAQHFHGSGAPVEFSFAWLHHIHKNPHHWQHYMYGDRFTPKNANVQNGVLRMPNKYALEMIADWMGASRVYTGSWDMSDWLTKNLPRIVLHDETKKFVKRRLRKLGYDQLLRDVPIGKENA